MKAYLIAPAERQVTAVDIRDDIATLDQFYLHLNCRCITTMPLGDEHMIYVDDEGLISGPVYQFFAVKGYPQPIAGRGLVFGGVDAEGRDLPPTLDLAGLRRRLAYIEHLGKDVWAIHPASAPKQTHIMTLDAIITALDNGDTRLFPPDPTPRIEHPPAVATLTAQLVQTHERAGVAGVNALIDGRGYDPDTCHAMLENALLARAHQPKEPPMPDKPAFELAAGHFNARINDKAAPDNKRPVFDGSLKLPDTTDERRFALWGHVNDKGTTIFTGKLSATAQAQIDKATGKSMDSPAPLEIPQKNGKPLVLEADTIILFNNSSKLATTPDRPDYWGYLHAAGESEPLRLAAWSKTDRNGRAYLSGNISREDERETDRDNEEER